MGASSFAGLSGLVVALLTAHVLACSDDTGHGGSTASGSTVSTGAGGSGAAGTGAGGTGAGAGGAGGAGGVGTGGSGSPDCSRCVPASDLGMPANGGIVEASGLAASAIHAGAYYVNNDSGDSARFFAFGEDGADLGTYNVTGASAVDWEDMARGPCAAAGSSCLYLGDIGDNPENRTSYVVYRVPEPRALSQGAHSVTAETFTFQYPDGSHNAEALLVHPQTGGVFIVTKSAGNAQLYAFPLPLIAGTTATLMHLGDVSVPGLMTLVTGGDIRPQGDAVLLRTYGAIWHYPIASGATLESALATRPCEMPSAIERQGETVAWAPDGNSFRTISEGSNPVLHSVSCR